MHGSLTQSEILLYSKKLSQYSPNMMRVEVKMLNTKDYNALSLAQPTNFKAMLKSGELLWGTGCRIPHPEAARVIAATPYHFCFLDAVRTL